jgi:DNA modification methylase
MKPYYEEAGIQIFHGDCREILPQLGRFDLLLTDPPYGIFRDSSSKGLMFGKETIYSRDSTAPGWDKRPDSKLLIQVRDVADKHVIWGGNYFADVLGSCKGPLVWNKLTGNNSYADGEIAWSSVAGTTRIFTHQWCGAFKDSERGLRAIHPTQKPVALMKWCIGLAGCVCSLVDTFMGSGTSLVAAKDLGILATGIELEERYCEIAANRLRQSVLNFEGVA